MNIVKGLITSIDFNGNTCVVRLPLFESAANEKELLVTATFATQPGIYNGYKVDDVVYVAFENNEIDSPVVIGKLYLGADKESKDPRGAINAESLKSSSPMTLPIDTHLTLNNDEDRLTSVKVDGELAGYKTIADFARKLKKQDTKVGALNIRVIDDGTKIGHKVDQHLNNIWTEDNRTIGFGWDINDQRWRVYSSDTSRTQNQDLDILTVDPHGVTIMGDVKIVGYPTATLTIYAQTSSSTVKPKCIINQTELNDNTNYKSAQYPISTTNLPIFDNTVNPPLRWQLEPPSYVSGKYIWEKTITFSYQPETEDGRKVVNEYWISKTICTSGSTGPKGDDATSYTISLSSPIHTGELQAEDIVVTALAQTGNNPIGPDNSAAFYINGNPASSSYVSDNVLTLPAAWFVNQETDIRIQVKHNNIVIDDETITYSPLNTPALDLTNDNAAIAYDGNTKLGSDVSTTATLYLNGEPLATSYAWVVSGIPNDGYSLSNSNKTLTVTKLSSDSATATVTATVSSGAFVNKTYSKVFTITKQLKGGPGDPGAAITDAVYYYKEQVAKPVKPTDGQAIPSGWTTTIPTGATENVWRTLQTTFDNGTIKYTDPIKDEAYALAQGKTTNYYSDNDPAGIAGQSSYGSGIKLGDCWFGPVFEQITSGDPDYPSSQSDYIGKYIQKNSRYILITQDNLSEVSDGDIAYRKAKDAQNTNKGTLKQWNGTSWEDISKEIVANKVTANYINALDITAKKITVLQDNSDDQSPILFQADGLSTEGKVRIAGFNIRAGELITANPDGTDKALGTGTLLLSSNGLPNKTIDADTLVHTWLITAGANFGVDDDGSLFAADATFKHYIKFKPKTLFSAEENSELINPGDTLQISTSFDNYGSFSFTCYMTVVIATVDLINIKEANILGPGSGIIDITDPGWGGGSGGGSGGSGRDPIHITPIENDLGGL